MFSLEPGCTLVLLTDKDRGICINRLDVMYEPFMHALAKDSSKFNEKLEGIKKELDAK